MFFLNPPGDNRPWTPALRRELIGDDAGTKSADASNEIRGQGAQRSRRRIYRAVES